MKINKYIMAFSFATLAIISGCSKDAETQIDTQYPAIDISSSSSFPKQCSIVRRGEKFIFRANLSDNLALGSISVDIHHNFDHHTHSTEVASCEMYPQKIPTKPFLLIQSYSVPQDSKTYFIEQEIPVPADIDPGDYHFMIRLTDKEGWQTIKGLSIKIN